MGRDFSNYERNERRGFGGRDNWDADMEEGYDPYSRVRPTRGSGWEGSPVTGYREADPRDFRDRDDDDRDDDDRERRRRYRQQPVNWGRGRGDEQRQMSRSYDLDMDVYRSGDRDEWRGEFGPKEDRTQWGRGQNRERDWRGTMRGAVREGRDWLESGRDRYRSWRESGDDPYRERRTDRSGDDRFGSIDDARVRYGRDDDRNREQGFGGTSGYARRDFDRDRNWGRSTRGDRDMQRTTSGFAGRGPRGYQRSDERIREDVSEILWEHDDIDASDIDVTVENGEVTLEGTVDSRWTKRMAEDAAHEARGVVDVHNRLRINREQPTGWDRGTDRLTQTNRAVTGNVRLEGGRTGTGLSFAPDMTVVGADGDEVGIIKEVRSDTVLVDRPMARDIYVPFSAVAVTDGSTARLNVRNDEIDNQGWQNPPMTGTDSDYDESVQLT